MDKRFVQVSEAIYKVCENKPILTKCLKFLSDDLDKIFGRDLSMWDFTNGMLNSSMEHLRNIARDGRSVINHKLEIDKTMGVKIFNGAISWLVVEKLGRFSNGTFKIPTSRLDSYLNSLRVDNKFDDFIAEIANMFFGIENAFLDVFDPLPGVVAGDIQEERKPPTSALLYLNMAYSLCKDKKSKFAEAIKVAIDLF